MAASSATRVRDVHERLTQRNDEKGVGAVWTAIFDIPVGHVKKEDWTMEAAMAFRAEVDHIREVLDELGVPASATASVFKRLKDVASPTTFSHSWESQKKFIVAPECGLVLEWAVWALRDHAEPEVAAEHFETIEEQLKGLEEALATTEMSPALRAFIQAQVDEIREAMRLYPVVGIRALDKAVEAATGAFAVQRRAIAEDINQKSPGAKSLVKKTIEAVNSLAEFVESVTTLGNTGKALANHASEAGPAIKAIGEQIFKQIGVS